jgi:hypothetical protein
VNWGEIRTEISQHQLSQMLVDIFAQEQEHPADTKDTSIAIRVASLKLLDGGRDVGEAREEDVHNGERIGWDWLEWQGITIVCCHCVKCCTWTARQDIEGKMECWSGSGKADMRVSLSLRSFCYGHRGNCVPLYGHRFLCPSSRGCLILLGRPTTGEVDKEGRYSRISRWPMATAACNG